MLEENHISRNTEDEEHGQEDHDEVLSTWSYEEWWW